VPRAYLGFDIEASRNSLSNVDVRFAKATMRIQQQLIAGFTEICRMHLAILGVDPDVAEWELEMKLPSHIFELAQIELMGAKLDVAERLKEWMPKPWVMERVLGFSSEEAVTLDRAKAHEMEQSQLRDAATQQQIADQYPQALGPEEAEGPGPEAQAESVNLRKDVMRSLDRLESRIDKQGSKMSEQLEGLIRPVRDIRRSVRRPGQQTGAQTGRQGLRRVV
jgi:hypothetical protein